MKRLSEIKTIHLIPYAHCDYAWTNTRDWHVWRYIENLKRVAELMETHESYTFLIDNVLQTVDILERYLPEELKKIRKFAAAGRICVVNGGMDLVRPSNCGDELFIRNMTAGKRALQEKLTPEGEITVFLNADTGIGHSQMPQLLSLAGHKAYRLYRPGGAMDAMGIPGEFVWQGLDGSRILVSRGNYAGLAGEYITSADYGVQKRGLIAEELEPKLKIQQTEDLAVFVGGDDALPMHTTQDRAVDMDAFLQNWNRRQKQRMEFSTLYRYFERIADQPLPRIEGVIDACELSYNIPSKSTEGMYRKRFLIERKLLTAERLGVIAEEAGAGFDRDEAGKLWDGLMRVSGHALEALLADDYEDKITFARMLEYRADLAIRKTAEDIAAAAQKIGQVQHVVVNPHPFETEEYVMLHVTTPHHLNGVRLTDGYGRALEYQVCRIYHGDKPYENCICNEADVLAKVRCPAFGYESILVTGSGDGENLKDGVEGSAARMLETDVLRLTQEQGTVGSIEDADGTLFFAEGEPFAQLRFYRTQPTEDWMANFEAAEADVFRPLSVRMTTDGPLKQTMEVSGTIAGGAAKMTYSVYRGKKEVEIKAEFDSCGEEGYYTVAFSCDEKPEILAGIPFGIEQRDTEREPYGEEIAPPGEEYLKYERALSGQYFARHFTSFANHRARIVLLQGDCGIYYCHNQRRRAVEAVLLHTMDRSKRTVSWVQKTHDSFFGGGRHSFSFDVVLEQGLSGLEVQNLCLQKELPFIHAVRFSQEEGKTKEHASFLQVEGMAVTAVYKEGNDLIVRGFEADGKETEAAVRFGDAVQGRDCDLMLAKRGRLDLDKICLRPHEIKTIRIEGGEK